MTNIIEIIGENELIEREGFSKKTRLSFYVMKYLQEKITANRNFVLEIKHQDDEVYGYGMSYSNELKVVNKSNEEDVLFTTGMLRWRAGHRDSLDRPEHRILEPSIITNEGNCLTFGYRTGNGNIAIYKMTILEDKTNVCLRIELFRMREYMASLNRERLIKDLMKNKTSFYEYINEFTTKTFGRGWKHKKNLRLNEEFAISFLCHYDSDSDAAVDKYRFFIWKKEFGVGFSDVYHTNLSNSRRDYVLGIGVDAKIEEDGTLTVEAFNQRHGFHHKHSFKLETKED